METSVVIKNVTKKYKLYRKNREKVMDLILPKSFGQDFYALKNVSFEAKKGETIGFVGTNGSGKSTLLNIIAGIIPPTDGVVEVNGESAYIAVNAGLKNELTGRENIELKCLMLGFSKEQIKRMEPDIIEFADIGPFIDQPVKSYSSGMKSRLGFSISVNIDPDILIIDEALAVGDKAFAKKSMERMNDFKERGKTIFFVSHSTKQIKNFCDKVLWLQKGEVKAFGPTEDVLDEYDAFIKMISKKPKKKKKVTEAASR
ncbi:teichoic acids export ABC transporter ATP-binding subunit TagH [Fervidibacillus halotolerans]|uniref:Teichoic acids export ABC transporter ATP-binding subunit TagH n=1 Tax=Fervidibacillus halotolerans TaxID=2980027 RepID=A0A9E8M1T0_9BACI|nr:teichoic acids export ABC transporter ATP-binding subunit TagH [Fervidibacillus halotolerans]WAA13978.1 teichoic acids export ABC transporter ATP-binding subunit TagH [Fervidibacillus halotolerans]